MFNIYEFTYLNLDMCHLSQLTKTWKVNHILQQNLHFSKRQKYIKTRRWMDDANDTSVITYEIGRAHV